MSYKKTKNSRSQKGAGKETLTISLNNALQLHLISAFHSVFDLFRYVSLIFTYCRTGGSAMSLSGAMFSPDVAQIAFQENKHFPYFPYSSLSIVFHELVCHLSLSLPRSLSLMSATDVTALSSAPP